MNNIETINLINIVITFLIGSVLGFLSCLLIIIRENKALKKDKIHAAYEGATFELQEGFMFDIDSYERQSNGKGEMVNRGQKKILNIKYTPDFVSDSFIIECKGRANESFPIRWKMFKKYVKIHLPHVILYKPQNQKECDTVIELITKNKIK